MISPTPLRPTFAALGAFLASLLGAAGFAALVSACAGPGAPASRAEPSLYERLGGEAGVRTMVDDAIVNISNDKRINHRFANASGPQLTKNLVDLVCERTGGPCIYRGQNMADAHEGMHIGDAEFDALVEDMAKSMDKFKVAPRDKAEALAILAKMKNAIVGH